MEADDEGHNVAMLVRKMITLRIKLPMSTLKNFYHSTVAVIIIIIIIIINNVN